MAHQGLCRKTYRQLMISGIDEITSSKRQKMETRIEPIEPPAAATAAAAASDVAVSAHFMNHHFIVNRY